MSKILEIIKEDARDLHLLIIQSEQDKKENNQQNFEALFGQVVVKNTPKEGYIHFRTQINKPVDLIIIHTDGIEVEAVEFVRKVRERDLHVQIIVLAALDSCSALREMMLYGLAAILVHPYMEEDQLQLLKRVVSQIHERKLLEFYVNQLEVMAKENIARKSEIRKQNKTQEVRTPKLKKIDKEPSQSTEHNSSLVNKYMIRNSVNEMENVDVNELDSIGQEQIQHFREEIFTFESELCRVDHANIPALRKVLQSVLQGLRDLVRAINVLGVFPIAANAANNLIEFVENLQDEKLQDEDKRELFIDILVSMLADFDTWINHVFIEQTAQNIHYFDASFANTCLELEMIFKEESVKASDEDTLEFF